MRIDKLATVLVATLCGLLLPGAASARGPYPPGPPNLSVTPAVIQAGEPVTVTGSNFGPNDTVRITVQYLEAGAEGPEGGGSGGGCGDSERGSNGGTTVVADASGGFTTTLTLYHAGTADISAAGSPSGIVASAQVLVLCDGGGDQPAASGSSVPAWSTVSSSTKTVAGIFGGFLPAVIGFALR